MTDREVVVIGAGSAGIAAAVALKDAGLSPLVLDRATQVDSSSLSARARWLPGDMIGCYCSAFRLGSATRWHESVAEWTSAT